MNQFFRTPPPTAPLSRKPDEAPHINELRAEVAALQLQVQTLARLLMAKDIVREEELNAWLEYVDGLDGKRDGRSTRVRMPRICANCNRANGPRAATCQWCGDPLPAEFLDQPADTQQPPPLP
jgi:hypothetical protein